MAYCKGWIVSLRLPLLFNSTPGYILTKLLDVERNICVHTSARWELPLASFPTNSPLHAPTPSSFLNIHPTIHPSPLHPPYWRPCGSRWQKCADDNLWHPLWTIWLQWFPSPQLQNQPLPSLLSPGSVPVYYELMSCAEADRAPISRSYRQAKPPHSGRKLYSFIKYCYAKIQMDPEGTIKAIRKLSQIKTK